VWWKKLTLDEEEEKLGEVEESYAKLGGASITG